MSFKPIKSWVMVLEEGSRNSSFDFRGETLKMLAISSTRIVR